MVLMIAAGLLLRGLSATYTVDPGFKYRGRRLRSRSSPMVRWLQSRRVRAVLQQRLVAAIEALPGVEAVARTDQDPLGDDSAPIAVRLPG